MSFKLMELPYSNTALEPHISRETIDYHYGKHHQTYVDTLNKLADDNGQKSSLPDIIKSSEGELFNNAAQVWNHDFYWHGLSPNGGGTPGGELAMAIDEHFGSLDKFKEAFNQSAGENFGSGWTWLVKVGDGELKVVNTSNADTPVAHDGVVPLLTVDVWEHAYYIDYRNSRPDYLKGFWELVDWSFVSRNLDKAS